MKKNIFLILSAAAMLASCGGEPASSPAAQESNTSKPSDTTAVVPSGDVSPDSNSDSSQGEAQMKNVQFVDSSEQYTNIYIFNGYWRI